MTIEEIMIGYLIDRALPGIDTAVYAEKPVKDVPDSYILVQRAGGSMSNGIRHYTMYTEVRSITGKLHAARLHEEVIEALAHIRDETALFQCALSADYDATTPKENEYRYQAMWLVTM